MSKGTQIRKYKKRPRDGLRSLIHIVAGAIILVLLTGCPISEKPLLSNPDSVDLPEAFLLVIADDESTEESGIPFQLVEGNVYEARSNDKAIRLSFKKLESSPTGKFDGYILQYEEIAKGKKSYIYYKADIRDRVATGAPILEIWTINNWQNAEVREYLSSLQGFKADIPPLSKKGDLTRGTSPLMLDNYNDLEAVMSNSWNFPTLKEVDYYHDKYEIYVESDPTSMAAFRRKYAPSPDKPEVAKTANTPPPVKSAGSNLLRNNWIYNEEQTFNGPRKNLISTPTEATGNYAAAHLRVSCDQSDMAVEVMWGTPMKNAFPNSTQDGVIVNAQLGKTSPWRMGWSPDSDFYRTRQPTTSISIGGSIDSLIFGALGVDHKNEFNWTPRDLSRKLYKESANRGSSSSITLRARAKAGHLVALTFDLQNYKNMVDARFPANCR